eukprot:COSAG02_NODE_10361_length_1959_cov_3.015054_1_plen_533_part_10
MRAGALLATATVQLLMALSSAAGMDSSPAPLEIHMWWKPANASSLAADVASMRSQLFVTDVIIYCGMAVLDNGTVGAEPTRPGARPGSDDWGLPELCPAAIEAAATAGLGVQVILEGRATAAGAGPLGAALSRGGATVGSEAVRFLSVLDPKSRAHAINIDWERGGSKWSPPTALVDSFFAAFAASVRLEGLNLTVCGPGVAPSKALTGDGLSRVFTMATYHGNNLGPTNHHDWDWKLKFDLAHSGESNGFVVGLMAQLGPISPGSEQARAWENSTASVVHKFSTMRELKLRKIALFCWPGFLNDVWPGLAAEWRGQLKAFATAGTTDSSTEHPPKIIDSRFAAPQWETVSSDAVPVIGPAETLPHGVYQGFETGQFFKWNGTYFVAINELGLCKSVVWDRTTRSALWSAPNASGPWTRCEKRTSFPNIFEMEIKTKLIRLQDNQCCSIDFSQGCHSPQHEQHAYAVQPDCGRRPAEWMQLGADSRVRAIDREWEQARLEHVLQRLRGRQGVRKRLLSHVFLLHPPPPPPPPP